MIRTIKRLVFVFICSLALLFQLSCTTTKVNRSLKDPSQFNTSNTPESIFKIHMRNGCLYILSDLTVYPANDSLIGYGNYYSANRKLIKPEDQSHPVLNGRVGYKISFKDIAIIETNKITGVAGKIVSMSLVGTPTIVTSVYCLINPKACFGSCPTFYAWNGENMELMAEGFS